MPLFFFMHLIIQLVQISLKGLKFLTRLYLSGIGILLAFSAAVFYFIWSCLNVITTSDLPSFTFLEPVREAALFISNIIQQYDVATLFVYAISLDTAVDGLITSLFFMANVLFGGFLVTVLNIVLISSPALVAKIRAFIAEKKFKP